MGRSHRDRLLERGWLRREYAYGWQYERLVGTVQLRVWHGGLFGWVWRAYEAGRELRTEVTQPSCLRAADAAEAWANRRGADAR